MEIVPNLEVEELEGGKIALIFDPSVDQGPSQSGKNNIVTSTRGAVNVHGMQINLNVYRKVTKTTEGN